MEDLESTYIVQSDLIKQCRANNRKAQLAIYRKYCDGMYCVAMRFLKNADDAEDVLQEAFIKAFTKIDQFRGEVTFGAWLKRIVVNKCLDFIKSRNEQYTQIQENMTAVEENNDWEIASGIGIEQIREAMSKLPDKYREVVQLYLVEGYDHSEISEILGLTNNTSRSRLLRGKGHLKKLLKEKYHVTGS